MIRKRVFIVIVVILILGLLETGCREITGEPEIETIEDASEQEDWKISVWAAYWDLDRVQVEVRDLEKYINNFCYFAAYFDNKNRLMLPEAATQIFQIIEEEFDGNGWMNYLTIVNDKIEEDGTFSLKDTELLYELFASDEDMDKHIDQILSLTLAGGYDGIEIDYEAIKRDMDLWRLYEKFCRKLYKKASEAGLNMRVVLEPNAPIEELTLPEGPDYIMMCYNLHGANTEPGPKADAEFIRELIEKMSGVPGNKEFAIATGGFDWNEEGKTEAVSQIQAEGLIKEYDAEAERDEESQCVKFVYEDTEGVKHEVWYADTVTLHYWMDIISESGEYGISIWRLGGNKSEEF
ncbi:MAG: glycosyl hydrolase [Bacillota bacterium]